MCITQSVAGAIALKDDLGRAVELKAPAQRVVTLAPFLTELAFSAGANVVGVSAFSDYPPAAKKLPQVASAAGISLEAVAALKPDLVLAWRDSMRPEEVQRLARLGTAVFVADGRTLADVPRLLRAIGELTGHDTARAAADFERRMQRLRERYASSPEVAVFLEIWHRPLTTISGRHFMNEALAACHARNVFADLPGVAPLVSWEALYARDPPVIVGVGSASDANRLEAQWRTRSTLAAVKAGRIVFVPADRLQRPTLRTPDGIAELCGALDRVRAR